jgi:hypothetical protein
MDTSAYALSLGGKDPDSTQRSPAEASAHSPAAPISFASAGQPRGEFTVAADADQALVSAARKESQLAVVDAQQLEARGVQVVGLDSILDGAEAEIVGRADDLAAAPNNKIFPRSAVSRNPEKRDFDPWRDQSRGTPPRRRGERID